MNLILNNNILKRKDMKKFVYIFATLLFCVTQANAQKLYIEDCDAPQGGVVTISVKYSTDGVKCEGAQMNLDLPEGLSFVTDENGDAVGTINPDIAKGFTLVTSKNGFAVYGTGSYTGEGTLLTFDLNVDPTLALGKELEVTVRNLSIPTADADIPLDPFTFKVTIVENIVTLDENSTTAPEAAENVDVKVLRTISASNWNTICLPFAMTGAQVKEAFGDGVKFANFTGYDIDDAGTELKVNFASFDASAGLEANHPCLIQVENKVTEFKVLGVTIAPEDEPTIAAIPRTKKQWSEMIGTYVAETVLDETYLFISGNNFYYGNADGKTKMKAFRAYFDFYDELTNKTATAKVGFNVDGEATSIDGYAINRSVEGVYDLSGRKIKIEGNDLNKLQKGVYIIDGKKVTIK